MNVSSTVRFDKNWELENGYSPRAVADNPLGTNVDVNRKPLSLCPFAASFKTISLKYDLCPFVATLKKISLKYDFKHILNDFYMYIAPGQGQTTPWGQNFDVNRNSISLCQFVASFKKKSLGSLIFYHFYIYIFNDFIHVYSPRAYNPFGTNFWCQQKALITLPICCKFKTRNLILYTFLMILYMYIAPGQGQTTPWGQTFDVNRKPLSLCPYVAGLKKNCFEVRFYTKKNHVSPYVYSPGQEQTIYWGQNFLYAHMLQVSKWSLQNLISYTFFFMILYMYIAPGARAENPLWINFWCQQKALITSTICCKFQTNLFEFSFYTHFLMFFHMYIAPGQGRTTLCGQNPDVNSEDLSLCPFVASFKKISLKSDFIHNFSCFYSCI